MNDVSNDVDEIDVQKKEDFFKIAKNIIETTTRILTLDTKALPHLILINLQTSIKTMVGRVFSNKIKFHKKIHTRMVLKLVNFPRVFLIYVILLSSCVLFIIYKRFRKILHPLISYFILLTFFEIKLGLNV